MRSLEQIERVEDACAAGKYNAEYAAFIMDNLTICNDETLHEAMENGYLYDEFVDYMIEKLLP